VKEYQAAPVSDDLGVGVTLNRIWFDRRREKPASADRAAPSGSIRPPHIRNPSCRACPGIHRSPRS